MVILSRIARLGIKKKLLVITLVSVLGFGGMQILSLLVLSGVVSFLPNFNIILEQSVQTNRAYTGVKDYLLHHDTLYRQEVNCALDSGELVARSLEEFSFLAWDFGADSLAARSVEHIVQLRHTLNRIMDLEQDVTERAVTLMNVISQRTLLWGNYWNTEKQSMAYFSQARGTLQKYYSSHDLASFGEASRQFASAEAAVSGTGRGFLTSSLRNMAKESAEIQQQVENREQALDSAQVLLDDFRESIGQDYTNLMQRANTTLTAVSSIILLGSIIIIAAIAFISFVVGTRLSRVYRAIVEALMLLRDGDLVTNPSFDPRDAKQGDEAGQMIASAIELRARLIELISLVTRSSRNVQSASLSMDSTSRMISEGAKAQASSSREVAITMDTMHGRISERVQMAKQSEGESSAVSGELNRVVQQVQGANEAVLQIARHVDQVRDIAKQTHLLALNAAVEAARAGEYGRGFAVVAQEVGKLAESSNETSRVIVVLVENAVRQSELTQATLQSIQPRVMHSAELSRAVSDVTEEQGKDAQQVNHLVQQLNDISRQNEQSSTMLSEKAVELSQLASSLGDAVNFFRVDVE